MGFFMWNKKDLEKSLNCPKCAIEMSKKKRNGITIDKCESCGGIWLDKGEIDIILNKIDFEKKKARKKKKQNQEE
ncbi:zf-TFIIB domain-containing protein [Candidatus Woesearchaeota archaeon]|nr:zf-TFIIB domain-containing protein [Candidatus Woesearchaeota archaeon]